MIGKQGARQALIGVIIAAASALMLALNDVAVPFALCRSDLLEQRQALPGLLGSALVIGAVVASEAWRNRKAATVECTK
jgi:hypothetical protein